MAITIQRQKKHLKSIGKSMLRHLQAYYDTLDAEELRRFRVQVKKLKALLAMVQHESTAINGSKNLKLIRSVYQHAGQIRSGHLHLALLEKYTLATPAFMQLLENTVKRETDEFNTCHKDYLKLLRKQFKSLNGVLQEVKGRVVLVRYKKQLKHLDHFFVKAYWTPEKLHKSRKKIKNLMYLYGILPKSLTRKLCLNIDYLDQLQEILGAWHDVRATFEWLKKEGVVKGRGLVKLQQEEEHLIHSVRDYTRGFAQKVMLKGN